MPGALLLIALLCLAPYANGNDLTYFVSFDGFPLYGVPSGSFPSWYERATLSWFNLVRHGATSFGTDYLKGLTSDSTYSNVFSGTKWLQPRALRWNLNLNRETRAHVTEYGTSSSCSTSGDWSVDCANSTSWSVRVGRFYNWDSDLYELLYAWTLVAPDARWPFYLVSAWMCDGQTTIDTTTGSTYGTVTLASCSADTVAGARNFTLSLYGEVGCGMYTTSSGGLATCDFATGDDGVSSGDGNMYPRSQSPIASGAHVSTTSKSSYFFIASYDYDVAISSAKVFINGTAVAMTLKYGNSTSGTWVTSTTYTASGGCKSYYFKFGDYYYPATGVFYTWGMGSCTSEYGSSGGATSCSLTLPSGASGWGTCNSTVSNTVTCVLVCKTGYTAVSGTCSSGSWTTTPSCSQSQESSYGATTESLSSADAAVFDTSSSAFAEIADSSATPGTVDVDSSTATTDQVSTGNCTLTLVTGASAWGTCAPSVKNATSCSFTCSSKYSATSGTCVNSAWTTSPSCVQKTSDASSAAVSAVFILLAFLLNP